MSSRNNMPPMVNPDRWTYDTGKDVFLCDPFNGVPICGSSLQEEPNTAPTAFTEHPELGSGYAIVKGRGLYELTGDAPMMAGVLLTDPTRAAGLGTTRDLRENMSQFDCVAYMRKRSALVDAATEKEAYSIPDMTAAGDLIGSDPYMDKLYGVAAEERMPIFSIDPPKDPFGRLEDDLGVSLRELENVIRAEVVMQVGRYPNNVLLVVPAEQGDMTRKCKVSGIPGVEEVLACDGLYEDINNHAYPNAMRWGKIPAEALDR